MRTGCCVACLIALGCPADSSDSTPRSQEPAPTESEEPTPTALKEPPPRMLPWPERVVTAEHLGTPFDRTSPGGHGAFFRNIWDLQRFGDLIYFGYGDAIHNSGPTFISSFDPKTGEFRHELETQEEAIMRLRQSGDRLLVPGADPIGRPNEGSLFVFDGKQWERWGVEYAVHCTDAIEHDGSVYVAMQGFGSGAAVLSTPDGGRTWREHRATGGRANSFFELGDELYVSLFPSGVARLGEKDFERVPFDLHTERAPPAPGADPELVDYLLDEPQACGSDVVFVGVQISNDASHIGAFPYGLFRVTAADDGPRVTQLPIPGEPRDVLEHDGHCYTVTNRKQPDGFAVAVYEAPHDGAWEPVLAFESRTMVRSAEVMGDYLYFGTGCSIDECSGPVGEFLRVGLGASP